MRTSLCLLLAFTVFFAGCAGRDAYPVASYIPGDEKKSCLVLKAEMAQIEADIANKLPKSDKTGGNIILGAAGVIIWPLWLFMDLKGADKIEVEAMQRRYKSLAIFAADKGCVVSGAAESVVTACSKCGLGKTDLVFINDKYLCLECHTKEKKLKEKISKI